LDAFEKVKETKPALEGVDDTLATARRRLMTEISSLTKPAKKRAPRRKLLVIGGLLGVAAAATGGVLVVGFLTAPVPRVEAVKESESAAPIEPVEPTATASPEPMIATGPEALRGAASAAAQFVPPALAPGQYLRHEWVTQRLVMYDPSAGSAGWSEPGWGVDRTTASSAWTLKSTGAYFSPADAHSDWYYERGPDSLADVFGDSSAAQEAIEASLLVDTPSSTGGPPQLPEGDGRDILSILDAMPREPQAIIDWALEEPGADYPGWAQGRAGWLLIDLLSYNVGDPELRSAMYEALSLLPGSTVGADVDGKRTVTFDSHLAAPDTASLSLTRYTLTIDMSTGLVTETAVTTQAGEGIIPESVPDSKTTHTMSVVDHLP